ncbi:MAG: hypothetical protein ACOYNY_24060 [Caldilineaceae bacterium]
MTLRKLQQPLIWAWRLAWATNAWLLTGFLVTALLESLLPATVALTGRGLINAIVAGVQQGNGSNTSLLSWLALGATLATSSAIISNLGDYWQQCLQDELYARIGVDVLSQASRLDLALMESREIQDHLERARRYGNGVVAQVIFKMVTLLNLGIRFVTLIGILLWIEPLVVGWLGLLALPALFLRWRLAKQTYIMQQGRTLKQRWTGYYTRILTDLRSLPEVKLFNLAPLFIRRFRTLSNEFLVEDRRLYRFTLWLNITFTAIGALGLLPSLGGLPGASFPVQ